MVIALGAIKYYTGDLVNLKIKQKNNVVVKSVKDINDLISSSGIQIIDNYSEHPQVGKSKD
jgi:hypothetical protein